MYSMGAGAVNQSLASKPMPVQFNLNVISYMSCPVSGNGTNNGDPLGSPFYRLRFGSFDNSSASGYVDPTGSGRAVDKIGRAHV